MAHAVPLNLKICPFRHMKESKPKWLGCLLEDLKFIRRKTWVAWKTDRHYFALSQKRFYIQHGQHLGDAWAAISYLIRIAKKTGQRQFLSHPPADKLAEEDNSRRMALARQILNILDGGKLIEISSNPAEYPLPIHPFPSGEIIPARTPRASNSSDYFTYQFDSTSRPDFNPDENEANEWLECFQPLKPVKIGLPLTLEESISYLLGARFHLGVSSGMAHVAASCGLPVLVAFSRHATTNYPVSCYSTYRRWFPYKSHVYLESDDLIRNRSRLRRLVGLHS